MTPSPAADPIVEAAVAGPRAAAYPEAVRAAVTAVRAGADLHYGRSAAEPDADRALLDGDARYADALAALAQIGDLEAIGELAETIAMVASAHAREDKPLKDATWMAAAAGIGWGRDDAVSTARSAVRAGDPAGADALVRAARQRAPELRTAL